MADFLGTLPHGDEMNLLELDLVEPSLEMAVACGSAQALSCYYPGENRIVASGDPFTASDNATQDYVIAHEYGHHLANHRNNSPFDNPAIEWGPKTGPASRASARGCGRAATSPATKAFTTTTIPARPLRSRSPTTPSPARRCRGNGPTSPTPTAAASRRYSATPCSRGMATVSTRRRGHFSKKRWPKKMLKRFATPLDGDLKLSLSGPDRAHLALKLRSSDGHILARSDGVGSQESVSYQICGERSVSAVVRRHGRRLTRFKLTALIP